VTHLVEVMNDLVTCLCDGLKDAGLPDTCFCGVVPGEVAAQEYTGSCDDACGMAWVRLTAAYPSNSPGIPFETTGNCVVPLGADIEMGVTRCMTIGAEDGSPPTQDELGEATALQIMDMLAMRSAVLCCPSLTAKDYILGPYTPFGPQGGLVGGTWQVSVGLT
jgi:hypothetical protein